MKALLDFSFTSFVAPSIAKIVYLLVMAVIAVSYLISVVVAFDTNTAFGVIVLLIVGPLFALFYLVLARVGLESLIATIRTAENTVELVRQAGRSGPVGVTPPPNYPPSTPGTGY